MAGEPTGDDRSTRALPPVRWRAVLGAALVTAAAGGVLVAHRAAQEPPGTRYLVVTSAVEAGHALTRADLGSVAVDLPDSIGAVPAGRAGEVVGRIVARNLGDLDLLRPSDLLERDRYTSPTEQEVTVTLDAARAPMGTLHVGDTVRALATATEGTGTRTLAEAVRVVGIDNPTSDGAIGATSGVRVRLAAPDGDTATAIVDAAVREHITLVLPSPADRGRR